jgi:hypothetical protein
MELLRPGFLLAGGLFALLPLALHLLVPRTRERRVLPTVRFLSPSARTRIRVQRRPTDLRLLALRMAFALLLGAAFAGVHWHGWGGGGTATLLVVDGGERLGPGWPGVQEAVVARWSSGDGIVVVDGVDKEGEPRVRRVVPSDPEELLGFLGDGDGVSPNTLAVLLRALRDEAAGGSAVPGAPDSIQAVLVSGARAGMWPPGLTRVRDLLWPGSVEWIPPRFPHPIPVPSVEVEAAGELAALLEGALTSAGWRVVPAPGAIFQEEPEAGPELRIRLAVVSVPSGDDLWRTPEESGGREATRDPDAGSTQVVLPDGRRFRGWGPAAPGTPGPGTMVPLFRSGGRPAAAARHERSSDGGASLCRVVVPLVPGGTIAEPGDPGVPDLLDGVLRWGCSLGDPAPMALETEVAAILARPTGPVAVRDIRNPGEGLSLTPIFLALALLLLLGEIAMIRSRRVPARTHEDGLEERMKGRP